MSKEFIVLAECQDTRSGKHFTRGSEFSPPPTVEQAERLVAAKCLPQGAIAAAEKVAASAASEIAKADKRGRAVRKAEAELEKAQDVLAAAQTDLDDASETDKPKATEARDEAKKAVDAAEAALNRARA